MKRLAAAVVVLLPCAALWLVGPPMIGQGLLALGYPGAAAALFDDPGQKGATFYFARRWRESADAFGTNAANAYNRGNALARAERFAEAVAAYDQALAAHSDDEDAAFNKALIASLSAEKPTPADANAINATSAASRARDTHDESHADGETGGFGDGFAGSREGASKPGSQGSSKAGKSGRAEQASFESGQGQAKGSADDSDGAGRTGGPQVDVAQTIRDRDRRVRRRMEARSIQPTAEWLSTLPDDPGRFLKLRILAEKARRKARSAAAGEEDDP
jgi:Ca-activated chloride channel family protein